MRYRRFYVPNTPATLLELCEASIPAKDARNMLGKIFDIQFFNPVAEPAVFGRVTWDNYAWAGANVENYPAHGVPSWTVPLAAVELRP